MARRLHGERLDDQAFGALDSRFRLPLINFFKRRLNNKAEAEDLTQEVFIRLMRHPDQNGGRSIDAYIFKIAANVLKDWLRHLMSRRANAHFTITDIGESDNVLPGMIEDRHPERVLYGKQSLKDVEEALDALGSRTREIFLLSRMENIPHRDIAGLYGISVSAVEKHVIKAVAYMSAKVFKS